MNIDAYHSRGVEVRTKIIFGYVPPILYFLYGNERKSSCNVEAPKSVFVKIGAVGD
jgi:hypothetical protein